MPAIVVRPKYDPVIPPHGPPKGRSARRFYRPELDTLRFLAFALVFLGHALPGTRARGPETPALIAHAMERVRDMGGFGVDLFFCLSAFLITTLLLRERERTGTIAVRSFYIRRILRIWPLYFLALLLTATVVPAVLHGDGMAPRYWAMFVSFLGNWATALWGWPATVASILWSVSIEEQFYLIWPIVLRRSSRYGAWCVAMSCLVVSTLARLAVVTWVRPQLGASQEIMLWTLTVTRLDSFAVGMMLALWMTDRAWAPRSWVRAMLLVTSLALWQLAVSEASVGPPALARYPLITVGAALLFMSIYGANTPLLRWNTFVWLGKVAYGLYVFHLFALRLVLTWAVPIYRSHLGAVVSELLTLVAGLALTAAIAWLSYRFIEAPFLRMKEHFAVVPSRPT